MPTWLRVAAGSSRQAVEQASNRWQQEMAAAPDPASGVRAFLAKEDPVFTWNRPVISVEEER